MGKRDREEKKEKIGIDKKNKVKKQEGGGHNTLARIR